MAKQNATIFMRSGGVFITQIDIETETPGSIGNRMESGFIVCTDDRWDKPRTLVINLADVEAVSIEGPK